MRPREFFGVASVAVIFVLPAWGAEWPRWRGPGGRAVSDESTLPVRWSANENVRWKASIPGEGFSSPIVWRDRLFVTTAFDQGMRREIHALDASTGATVWRAKVEHDNPEVASAMTGHAASTPVTDGRRVVAWFGNAGVLCVDERGKRVWHRDLGEFDSELGLASSPVFYDDRVILVCDHDGDRFTSFDSFLIALDLETGRTVWKTGRAGLSRSWSTPVLVSVPNGASELIVNAQDHLRGYDPRSGQPLWRVEGMTGWVTPSPVYGHGLIFATSGRDGPVMAVRPAGRGDVTQSRVAWSYRQGAPYVCSPVLYGDYLYVHNERGIVSCFQATSGRRLYRQRLNGKFWASSVAGDGKVYFVNENGTTFVVRAGPEFKLLATNSVDEYTLASPAIHGGCLYLRTEHHLYCVGPGSRSKSEAK